ncbi:MAG: HsdR family type I site-specific deoxyribonuclease [Prevotellaceae bacterium]|jgi:type I restriction enzyme R subunit|nr:HsdR family type I site-specific deoxyribonuclease [Prevotellaceae bacterium]
MEFIKGNFTEADLENVIIGLFKQQGYTHITGEQIHRRFTDVVLEDDLRVFLQAKYKNCNLMETEIKTIISKLINIPALPEFQGNKETFWLLNRGFDFAREDSALPSMHIDYIDFDNTENNSFKVVNQFTVEGEHTRRPDMLLFINGIPVVIFEFKSAVNEDATLYNAYKQITIRYKRDIPALTKYTTLAVLSDGANTKLGTLYTPYPFFYSWNRANDTETRANGISSLLTMVKGAFAKDRILSVLRDFTYFADTKEKTIVCRYPQFFGANKIFENIKKHLKPDGDGKGGTYFGATGCGKTYTMLFLARLITLRDSETFRNPTIIILEDREDLDTQTSELFVESKNFLGETNVKSIESRADLREQLKNRPSGGVYITTVQKFCEEIGLLSGRNNIICISDEAHRTQTNVGSKLKFTEKGVKETYGFAYYLRESFPNATYCGFTGTPIDETIAVFGKKVDSYTMKESTDDEITVRIAYEPRLARVIVDEATLQEINTKYAEWREIGANPEQIEKSKQEMSQMRAVLGHPDRLQKLATDMAAHYEKLTAEKPAIVQKAMIVCADRGLAFSLYKEIRRIRPEWFVPKKTERTDLSKDELDKLTETPKLNLVATQGQNDEAELFSLCGNKEYRSRLDKLFKNPNSNFRIAIVVDMWITGFDVPELAVMYIDKPLQKHTLIQTISRVNRKSEGKEQGLIVDYIGIKEDMLAAVKQYGTDAGDNPIDEINIAVMEFRNSLKIIGDLLVNFNTSTFFTSKDETERLMCINAAVEFVQTEKDRETKFMGYTRRLKAAFAICSPSGELTAKEVSTAQFYLAIRSIIYKQTKGDTPDAETMNAVIQAMVEKAIACTGIENIVNSDKPEEIFGGELEKEALSAKLPITKFNALVKILKKAITAYGKKNKLKEIEFNEMLKKVIEAYNNRDKLVFTSEVVADFINGLSDEIIKIYNDLQEDINQPLPPGFTFEDKVFYDILVKVRDDHNFIYDDDKCWELAAEIKKLVADKSQYADFANREDVKAQLNRDLTVLLYNNGYPPEWDEEVFAKVMEQAQNFKRWEE